MWFKKKGQSKKVTIECETEEDAAKAYGQLVFLWGKQLKKNIFTVLQDKNKVLIFDKAMTDVPKSTEAFSKTIKTLLFKARVQKVLIEDWDGKKYE